MIQNPAVQFPQDQVTKVTMVDEERAELNSTITKTWAQIEPILIRLYNLQESPESWFTPDIFMNIYTLAYEGCTQRSPSDNGPGDGNVQGRELYLAFCRFYETRLLPSLQTHLNQSSLQAEASPEAQINAFLSLWERYRKVAKQIESIFQYLDRYWIARQNEERKFTLHLYALLWKYWDERILRANNAMIEQNLLAYCEDKLMGERMAAVDEQAMQVEAEPRIKAIFSCYDAISRIPKDSLLWKMAKRVKLASEPMKERLLPWYSKTLQAACDSVVQEGGNMGEKPLLMLKFWNSEVNRIMSYFEHPVSVPIEQILKLARQTMKTHLVDPVWETSLMAVRQILATEEDHAVGMAVAPYYQLAATRKSLLLLFEEALQSGLLQRYSARLASPPKSTDQIVSFLGSLQEMHQKHRDAIIKDYLANDQDMMKAADRSLKGHVSSFGWGSNLAEFLARWIDRLIRSDALVTGAHSGASSPMPLSKDSIETGTYQFLLLLLGILDDRDKFRSWYAWFLSRRLLSGKGDRGIEESLLAHLQQVYGHGYIANLQRLISDSDNSLTLNDKFTRKVKKARVEPEIAFRVFGKNAWPWTEEYRQFPWDPSLCGSLDAFDAFYLEQHPNRKLVWNPEVTQVELLVTPTTGKGNPVILVMSAIQYAILDQLLKGHHQLQSMATALTTTTGNLTLSIRKMQSIGLITTNGDAISLNPAFSTPHTKVNICPSIESTRTEVMESGRDVSEDQSFVLQARIVHHLKRVTSCSKTDLIKLCSVLATPDRIDSALGLLESKEYIRAEGDTIHYIP